MKNDILRLILCVLLNLILPGLGNVILGKQSLVNFLLLGFSLFAVSGHNFGIFLGWSLFFNCKALLDIYGSPSEVMAALKTLLGDSSNQSKQDLSGYSSAERQEKIIEYEKKAKEKSIVRTYATGQFESKVKAINMNLDQLEKKEAEILRLKRLKTEDNCQSLVTAITPTEKSGVLDQLPAMDLKSGLTLPDLNSFLSSPPIFNLDLSPKAPATNTKTVCQNCRTEKDHDFNFCLSCGHMYDMG